MKGDLETFGIDGVVKGGELKVMNEPLFIYLFAFNRNNDFRSRIGLQQIKSFIQRIGFVIAGGVYLVADGFSC